MIMSSRDALIAVHAGMGAVVCLLSYLCGCDGELGGCAAAGAHELTAGRSLHRCEHASGRLQTPLLPNPAHDS